MTAKTHAPRHPRSLRSPGHRCARLTAAAALLFTVAACGWTADGADQESSLTGTVYIGGKTDQPGFNLHSEHTDRGFEPDLAAYLGKRLGFTPRWHDVVSAKREQELVEKSSALVIGTYSITPSRDEQVDFVGPYFVTKQAFLVRADYDGITTEKDVGNKVICTVEGSTALRAALPGGATRHTESDYSTCVRKVQQGDVDAVFTDEALLYGYVEQQKNSATPVKVVPDVSFGNINRYGIALPEGRRDDCDKLRDALRRYITDEWASDVKAQLPALVAAYPGDWENRFRPEPQDVNTYSSCKE
ncbi:MULTISPECIES: transporter substrate-binding domain-containing protein [Streptomyces]|uniref:Transporter substrate-binding domain-containing protein n=1 Tax=Streptomyces edwardsiae TaxID=3075527 RepID=A0ABU2PVQ3_9ACTN|nr:transporter substrate-binding domain-containing protein [Streptomyces sp. DSM 41636]MDT0396249.1 transporter substrate-binding domain-containing protein [Streptomyces sp. DSM 41636]